MSKVRSPNLQIVNSKSGSVNRVAYPLRGRLPGIRYLVSCIFLFLLVAQGWAQTPEQEMVNCFWIQVGKLRPGQRPKTALVLSGGGGKGLAHIGVLKVLEEEKIPLDLIVGTSAGALIGSLYSAGLDLKTIEEMANEMKWQKLREFRLSSRSLYSNQKLEDYITRHIGGKNFDELKIPFVCVATDLANGEKVIFKEGRVAPAVRASSSIPGVFAPVEYQGRLFSDGGVVDNIPVDVARALGADIIIASVVTSRVLSGNVDDIFSVLGRVIAIQLENLSRENLTRSDVVITPEVSRISAFDLSRAEECVREGVKATRDKVFKIKTIILQKSWKEIL